MRLCLLECRDPLITSRNGDLHFPSHNCFTTSARTRLRALGTQLSGAALGLWAEALTAHLKHSSKVRLCKPHRNLPPPTAGFPHSREGLPTNCPELSELFSTPTCSWRRVLGKHAKREAELQDRLSALPSPLQAQEGRREAGQAHSEPGAPLRHSPWRTSPRTEVCCPGRWSRRSW